VSKTRCKLHIYRNDDEYWTVCGWLNPEDFYEDDSFDCWESAWITACGLVGYEWRSIHGKNYD
jgi:hypothetical protein